MVKFNVILIINMILLINLVSVWTRTTIGFGRPIFFSDYKNEGVNEIRFVLRSKSIVNLFFNRLESRASSIVEEIWKRNKKFPSVKAERWYFCRSLPRKWKLEIHLCFYCLSEKSALKLKKVCIILSEFFKKLFIQYLIIKIILTH